MLSFVIVLLFFSLSWSSTLFFVLSSVVVLSLFLVFSCIPSPPLILSVCIVDGVSVCCVLFLLVLFFDLSFVVVVVLSFVISIVFSFVVSFCLFVSVVLMVPLV
jgi:hypothetical protein